MSSSATSAAPVSRPPVTRLTTPAGSSPCSAISRKKWIVRERRDLARLGDERVAGEDRRRELAAEHREREVPGADRGDDADRRAQQVDDLAGGLAGQDLALHAPVPLRGVAQQVLGEADLALRLAGRLADLADEDLGELVAVGRDDVREHRAGGRRA